MASRRFQRSAHSLHQAQSRHDGGSSSGNERTHRGRDCQGRNTTRTNHGANRGGREFLIDEGEVARYFSDPQLSTLGPLVRPCEARRERKPLVSTPRNTTLPSSRRQGSCPILQRDRGAKSVSAH